MLKDYTKETLQAVFNDENMDTDGLNFQETLEKMENFSPKQWAVFKYFGEDLELVSDISEQDIDTDDIDINGETLLVLTDGEADDKFEDALDNYIYEVIYPEIPECYQNYFDEERWKATARIETSRGNELAYYDGDEHEYFIEGETPEEIYSEYIYIYRR